MSSRSKLKTTPSAFRPSSRRCVQFDTELSSYDKKDPFSALNTLVKLVTSLSLRVGGCQYKLTPAEHQLSVHLLGIVEPFVGTTPSHRTSLIRQPTEILDLVAFHVEEKRDVFNLALSCKRMHDIVIPRHLDYRIVRCKVSNLAVWNHLIGNRALAKNVRRLEILDERATAAEELIPAGIMVTDTDLESTDDELGRHEKQERYIVAALVKMSSLTSFSWSCNHSPISIENVWPTLLKCYSLKQVEINDNLVFGPTDVEGEDRKRLAVLPELKTVALRSTRHAFGAAKHPALTRAKSLLHHCPNLQVLDITYNLPRGTQSASSVLSADDLFLFGRWPGLTSLTLSNLRLTSGFDAASTFLLAHPNIEVLNIDIGFGVRNGLGLPIDTLPRLRELKASDRHFVSALLNCPLRDPDALRPLETLKGVRLSSGPSGGDTLLFNSLRPYSSQLKRLELSGWVDMDGVKRLAECVPRLTWLDLGKKHLPGGNVHQATSKAPVSNLMEWATALSAFSALATFHGVRFFYEVSAAHDMSPATSTALTLADRSRIRKNDEIAGVLAWKCAKLRRVDHWEHGSGKVVVLVRDVDKNIKDDKVGKETEGMKEKVRWEVRRIKQAI
ncbi:hypothetical protein C8J56DRAFT_774826 [Mycena floridula]|nr:hypothetical protein C8J56DRAFT_774826 [Mycena floridula]